MIRTLIVDDEEPARARLRQMLGAHGDVEVVGEAASGVEAIVLIGREKPDVVLLDIQMPGCSGIDVAASLARPRPHVIFCTAWEQHAVDAFELQALDYLLKPVSRARLAKALERVRAMGGKRPEEALDEAALRPRQEPARFLVRSQAHYLVVGEGKAVYLCSQDGLTQLVAENGRYWMDPTLNELEERLDARRFFRISRSALVSLNCVTEVFPLPGGGGEVLMKNGDRLEVSRRRYRELLEAIAGEKSGIG